jgi:hypothetical protein
VWCIDVSCVIYFVFDNFVVVVVVVVVDMLFLTILLLLLLLFRTEAGIPTKINDRFKSRHQEYPGTFPTVLSPYWV